MARRGETLFTLTTLTIFYDYEKGNGSHYSFASVPGAKKDIAERLENDKENHIDSYSIEEVAYSPMDENEPDGRLSLGVRHFEFVDVKEQREKASA